MATFHDQMKLTTERLQHSVDERHEALEHLHNETDRLLEAARTFMSQVSQDQQAVASRLHETLETQRTELATHVKDLRQHNQQQLRHASDELRKRLTDGVNNLRTEVAHLADSQRRSRQALADDLRQASMVWHKFAARS